MTCGFERSEGPGDVSSFLSDETNEQFATLPCNFITNISLPLEWKWTANIRHNDPLLPRRDRSQDSGNPTHPLPKHPHKQSVEKCHV